MRTEPHPRFYTDTTGTIPIAVPALLRTEWWPMISFVVFKSPAEGQTHIFRPGEPMLQILILPATADFALVPMNDEEAAEREMRGRRIDASRDKLAADLHGYRAPTRCSTVPTAIFFVLLRRKPKNNSTTKKFPDPPAVSLCRCGRFPPRHLSRTKTRPNDVDWSRAPGGHATSLFAMSATTVPNQGRCRCLRGRCPR